MASATTTLSDILTFNRQDFTPDNTFMSLPSDTIIHILNMYELLNELSTDHSIGKKTAVTVLKILSFVNRYLYVMARSILKTHYALNGHDLKLTYFDITEYTTCTLQLIQWSWQNGCRWYSCETIYRSAAKKGDVDALLWMTQHGFAWNRKIHRGANLCYITAESGHLDVLKWISLTVCMDRYPWDSNICRAAAKGNHLDVLRWLRENGCDWYGDTCDVAADKGHVDILI